MKTSQPAPKTSRAGGLFTVVIASLCSEARGELLKRACESIRAMAGDNDYSIVIVANGPNVSPNVLAWLATRPDVHVIHLKSGSHPLARRVGAEMADCEFLAFLDDDDELIADTLAARIAEFRRHPEVDVLITDGLRINGPDVTRIFPPPEARHPDLIRTMMQAGWGAGALTLRLRNIDLAAFDPSFRHLEWTLTVLDLASRYRFAYLDLPTYRYYENTPNSLSKMRDHNLAAPEVWRRLSNTYAGTPYESTVRRRYGVECHGASYEYARRGLMRDAWRLHAESLMAPGGMAFLWFSAWLLLAPFRRPSGLRRGAPYAE